MTHISDVLEGLGYSVEPAFLDIVVRSDDKPVFRYVPLHTKGRGVTGFMFTKAIDAEKVGKVEQMINSEEKYKGIKRLHREITDNSPTYGGKILTIYLSNFNPKKDEKVMEISDFLLKLHSL